MKKYLGIEGVHLELQPDTDSWPLRGGILSGSVLLASLSDRQVRSLKIELTERYQLGRGSRKSIENYSLGVFEESVELQLQAGEQIILPFSLLYSQRLSRLDQNLLERPWLQPLGKLARLAAGAGSTFYLTARADVAGVALAPRTSVEVFLK